MFCTVCRDSFDIREVDRSFPSALLFVLVVIIATVILTVKNMTVTDISPNPSQSNLSTQVNPLD